MSLFFLGKYDLSIDEDQEIQFQSDWAIIQFIPKMGTILICKVCIYLELYICNSVQNFYKSYYQDGIE